MSAFHRRPLPAGIGLRPYSESDLEACMRIFESNRRHTLPDDPSLMRAYLEGPTPGYLVIEGARGIVACGGVESRPDVNQSHLFFGMVHRDYHTCGIGTLLVISRLALVDCAQGEEMILLETSHLTEGFYRQFGFEPVSGYEARYGLGLDYLTMGLWLYPEMQAAAERLLREYSEEIQISHDLLKLVQLRATANDHRSY
jgi:GNAT superfamily N-acetyltransferase